MDAKQNLIVQEGYVHYFDPLRSLSLINDNDLEVRIPLVNKKQGVVLIEDKWGSTLYANKALEGYYQGKINHTKPQKLLIEGNYYL